ncbi:MAG TPA: hypothetical protein VHT73_07740 [Thermodesulfobacteriota bacterium]|nr:hypothetical protein [Thermodesulfobacteriota bacterium]
MTNAENYHINYWGAPDPNYPTPAKKQGRSVLRKLTIVFSFLFILTLIPAAVYGLSKNQDNSPKVSSADLPVEITKPIPEPTKQIKPSNRDTVHSVDSYWKISKRNCGVGVYYLSIQQQNGGKPLHAGDSVVVNCSL